MAGPKEQPIDMRLVHWLARAEGMRQQSADPVIKRKATGYVLAQFR